MGVCGLQLPTSIQTVRYGKATKMLIQPATGVNTTNKTMILGYRMAMAQWGTFGPPQ